MVSAALFQFAALVLAESDQSVAPPTQNPSFCEVATNPAAYVGRTFSFEGQVRFTYHFNFMANPRCSQTVGIAWRRNDPRLRQLTELTTRAGLDRWDINARVTGTLRRAEDAMFEDWYELDLSSAKIDRADFICPMPC